MDQSKLNNEFLFPSFYAGQEVIAVDAMQSSEFINGQKYIVSSYEYKMNPVNGRWFWYIGIAGYHDWLRPSIFAHIIPPVQNVTFEKVTIDNPISIN